MKKSKSIPRLLMIGPLPPPVHGSAMMTQYLKDSKLINSNFKLDWVNLSTSRKMDEIGKRTPVKIFRFATSCLKTFWKLLTHRYDACYIALTCHGGGFLKDAPFALMCKAFGRKLIIHQHNKGMANDVDKPIFKWLLPMVYNDATVILLSWRLHPDIEKVVKKEQVRICPNGIPEATIYPKDNAPHVPRLLFLSNLLESKGVFVLLDACKILMDEGYAFQCRFVGGETKEIDAERFNEEVKKRGLDKSILYIGKKYGEEKNQIYAQSEIFILPTFDDCFPVTILEAMQQSTLVISTDVGGIPDMIDNGISGYVLSQNTPQELADQIRHILVNPRNLITMGKDGKKNFDDKYTIKAWENSIIAILKDVATVKL